MSHEQGHVTVSTDVMGLFSKPQDVQELYMLAGYLCDIELVMMPRQYGYFKELSRGWDVGFDLGGVHGQLGSVDNPADHQKGLKDWILVRIADMLLPRVMGYATVIPPLPSGIRVDMIASMLGKDIYFNVHNDTVAARYREYIDYGLFAKFSHLTIENGPGTHDIDKTNDLIHRLQDDGADKTTGTFDLVHAVIAMSGCCNDIHTVMRYWKPVLHQLRNEWRHLHFPVGLNIFDSLPIRDMLEEKSMLRDLAAVVNELNIHITFENQHSLLRGVRNYQAELDRLTHMRAGLQECGFQV